MPINYKRVTKLLEQLAAELKDDQLETVPDEFAQCADVLYVTREARLATQRLATKLDEYEGKLEKHFRDNLTKVKASGVAGSVGRVQLKPDVHQIVKDWDKVYAYIRKNNAFELLQRRVNEKALEERRNAGKPVPGSDVFKGVKVSCTAV